MTKPRTFDIFVDIKYGRSASFNLLGRTLLAWGFTSVSIDIIGAFASYSGCRCSWSSVSAIIRIYSFKQCAKAFFSFQSNAYLMRGSLSCVSPDSYKYHSAYIIRHEKRIHGIVSDGVNPDQRAHCRRGQTTALSITTIPFCCLGAGWN